MIKQSLRLGTIGGIPIGINSSWLLVFVLLTLSLAGHFGTLRPQWAFPYHYRLAVVASLLFFSSVLLHELGHSAVAQETIKASWRTPEFLVLSPLTGC